MNINFNEKIYDAFQLDPSTPREIRAIQVDVFYSDKKRPPSWGTNTGLKLLGF
jgi:hypothetical protein